MTSPLLNFSLSVGLALSSLSGSLVLTEPFFVSLSLTLSSFSDFRVVTFFGSIFCYSCHFLLTLWLRTLNRRSGLWPLCIIPSYHLCYQIVQFCPPTLSPMMHSRFYILFEFFISDLSPFYCWILLLVFLCSSLEHRFCLFWHDSVNFFQPSFFRYKLIYRVKHDLCQVLISSW